MRKILPLKALLKKILICMLFGNFGSSQAQDYEFSLNTRIYEPIANPISLNLDSTWDNLRRKIPIGFQFQFFDYSIDSLHFLHNGGGAVLITNRQPNGHYGIISAFGADIIDRGYNVKLGSPEKGKSLSSVSYQLSGLPGSQIFTIEWKNVGFKKDKIENNDSKDSISFQLRLLEASNEIQIHFGNGEVRNPALAYYSEEGPRLALFPSYSEATQSYIDSGYSLTQGVNSPSMLYTKFLSMHSLIGTPRKDKVYRFKRVNLKNEKYLGQNYLVLYPNPTSTKVHISGILPTDVYAIDVSALNGKTIQFHAAPRTVLDLTDTQKGIYLVTIYFNNGRIHRHQIIRI